MATPKNNMRPIHPGEILREDFLRPGESIRSLARALQTDAGKLSEILKEKRCITPETALLLAKYYGCSPQFFLNLQNSYDLKIAEKRLAKKLAKIPQRKEESDSVTPAGL